MVQLSSLDMSVYFNEFSENIECIKNAPMREKEQNIKKTIKTIIRFEKYINTVFKDFKTATLLEKAKLELGEVIKLSKKKDASIQNINRYIASATRYYEIALRDFKIQFAKSNDFISHDRKIIDPLSK
ncbi:MAG: hypothetical protein COA79_13190 [Planctomycetota bacterium]|nr:MAG: hypothetical protein COA79_13190 [Planctomycetota bacterium]